MLLVLLFPSAMPAWRPPGGDIADGHAGLPLHRRAAAVLLAAAAVAAAAAAGRGCQQDSHQFQHGIQAAALRSLQAVMGTVHAVT